MSFTAYNTCMRKVFNASSTPCSPTSPSPDPPTAWILSCQTGALVRFSASSFWYMVPSFWYLNLVHGTDKLVEWERWPGYTITLFFSFCISPGSKGELSRPRVEFPQSSQAFRLRFMYFTDFTKTLSYFVASFDCTQLLSQRQSVFPTQPGWTPVLPTSLPNAELHICAYW